MESITRLLGMIQKLKKIITPAKCFEKLQPMKVLEEIESILKIHCSKKRRAKKTRTYLDQKTKDSTEYFNEVSESVL